MSDFNTDEVKKVVYLRKCCQCAVFFGCTFYVMYGYSIGTLIKLLNASKQQARDESIDNVNKHINSQSKYAGPIITSTRGTDHAFNEKIIGRDLTTNIQPQSDFLKLLPSRW